MSVTIHKNDSDKAICEAIHKVLNRKHKDKIKLDRYFGKVSFDIDGLTYQKEVRNEWK
ncbi:hypothetical protein NC796_19710 [Aliifodinibius sp. S!AR15-10]|uniref:hypothetical protein n=1 Tax=Aliifodinibius sp. S!AR15-10 TaxID=2950437 RepID=UPI002864CD9D|nr:hypothetical protein [Aliifodinibius sp. S!AR15-10]MDR8393391.1 hypothetical protein [Aliifodinibius sp. S!AR15-10]